MIRLITLVALLVSFDATAAVRRLATDCTLPSSAPTASQPFDLDACVIQDGDDITQLLTDIRSKWTGGFYVRAPSKTVNVISNAISWPTATKYYYFLEDQDAANKMTIQHAANPSDFYTLWHFENFDTVKIGGPNLSLTFKGNHPGLANCDVQYPTYVSSANCDANQGLIEFAVTDGSSAKLAEVKANTRFAQAYSIYTWGAACFASECGTANHIQQFNVAGLHYATSGIFFHQGVINAWADPNSTVISDPYVRRWGWTGAVSTSTQGGLPIGCVDQNRDQVRSGGFAGYFTDSITGGVTFEYGSFPWVQRLTGRIGTSVNDPFIVRLKDWGISGPGTPYPAGVRVKKTGQEMLLKGDPHDKYSGAGPVRFVRFEKLKSTYGDGPASDPANGCSPSSAWMDGPTEMVIMENNTGGYNRDWDITFSGDWVTKFVRQPELIRLAYDTDTARVYGITVRAASGTTINNTTTMYDTNTLTGAGTFQNVRVSTRSPATVGRANTIKDTNVSGAVTIDGSTATTTISNVNFTGAARTIISVGSGSTAVVSKMCAPDGSAITGNGTLIYDGSTVALPYTVRSATACSPASTVVPSPPADVIVE